MALSKARGLTFGGTPSPRHQSGPRESHRRLSILSPEALGLKAALAWVGVGVRAWKPEFSFSGQ